MATQGPLYPSAAISLANAGTSENSDNWLNPTNIFSDNATESTIVAATYDSPDISQLLVASGFGFTIPTGSLINGIIVEIDRRSIVASSGKDFRVQLSTGTAFANLVGANKAVPATVWPTTSAVATYGSASDNWTAALTADQINASGFAVFLSAQANIANADIGVDFIRVSVDYTAPTVVSGSFTADALLFATIEATVSADSILKGTVESTLSADSIFAGTVQSTFTADAEILGNAVWWGPTSTVYENLFDASTVTETRTFTADSILRATISQTFTADAVLRATTSVTFIADSRILVVVPATFTANAILRDTEAATFTADAYLIEQVVGTGSYTANAILKGTTAATFTADARLMVPYAATLSANAVIKRTTSASIVSEGVLRATTAQTLSANAILRTQITSTFTANAYMLASNAVTFSANAVLRAVTAASFTANAVLLSTWQAQFASDAVLQVVVVEDFTADAVFKSTITTTFVADAILSGALDITFTADALIVISTAATFTADAVLEYALYVSEYQFSANSVLRDIIDAEFVANAVLHKTTNFRPPIVDDKRPKFVVKGGTNALVVRVGARPTVQAAPSRIVIK